MKHWYALASIAMFSIGTVACSGDDGGAAGSSTVQSDQTPVFNVQDPPWNPSVPGDNLQQTDFNSQDPLPNPQQATPPGVVGAPVTCEMFCATVDARCAEDCFSSCDTFDELGGICAAETSALFGCAITAHFMCDENGELNGGHECETQVEAWQTCIEQNFVQRQPDQVSVGGSTGGATNVP